MEQHFSKENLGGGSEWSVLLSQKILSKTEFLKFFIRPFVKLNNFALREVAAKLNGPSSMSRLRYHFLK